MTPKQKADELFNKMDMIIYTEHDNWKSQCIRCALIAVDEILEVTKKTKLSPLILRCGDDITQNSETFYSRYWTEVKQEIEKL